MRLSCWQPLDYIRFLNECYDCVYFSFTKRIFVPKYKFDLVLPLAEAYCHSVKAGHWLELRQKMEPFMCDPYSTDFDVLLDKRYIDYYYTRDYDSLETLPPATIGFILQAEQAYMGSAIDYDIAKPVDLETFQCDEDFELFVRFRLTFEDGESTYISCTICSSGKLLERFTTYFKKYPNTAVRSHAMICCSRYDYQEIMLTIDSFSKNFVGCSKNEILLKFSWGFDVPDIETILSTPLIETGDIFEYEGIEEDYNASFQKLN
ncbi:hypothetical protein QNI16_05485 [Cytophagaceae bacterium YF14B1]|uniref:Uncharacterized protein n=1 Tax=Xanthocytophaga flava TaxID=3048013 RepID=A0AAE3U7R4_9BACT|nr:hypothetical protein [Xanthocytophaga flavus]MDJ1479929.1 hypothetical protein [Xanthocytophaga flavus]